MWRKRTIWYSHNKKCESRPLSHKISTDKHLFHNRRVTVVVILSFRLRDWGVTLCPFGIRVGHGLLQNAIRLRSLT